MMKKFSILIKVEADTTNINETFKALKEQTILEDLEIFVTINHEGKTLIVKEMFGRYNLKGTIFELDNAPANFARTYHIPDCTSEYILFLDCNDIILPSFCEVIYNYAKSKEADIVFFDINKIDPLFNSPKREMGEPISREEYLLLDPCILNKIYKRTLFDPKDIYFNNLKYDELAVIPALAKYAKNIYYLDEAKYIINHKHLLVLEEVYDEKDVEFVYAIRKLYERLKDTDLIAALEFVYIDLLLFKFSRRFLKFKKNKRVNLCAIEVEERFLEWELNKTFKKQTFMYKLYCKVAYSKIHFLMRWIIKLEEYLNNKKTN